MVASLAPPAEAIGEVPAPEPSLVPAVLPVPVPEYEEIQELRQDNTRKQDYEFTTCPAYAVVTPV